MRAVVKVILSAVVLFLLLHLTTLPSALADGETPQSVEGVDVLIYFSPSDFAWVETKGVKNAFEALLEATGGLGWRVEWENSSYGVYIKSIRGVSSPPDYSYFWTVLKWNSSGGVWEYTPTSADTTPVDSGDAVAFLYCHTFGETPDPTPEYPLPVLSYSGVLHPPGPSWRVWEIRPIRTAHLDSGPIDTSPLITPEGLLVYTSGVMNYTSFKLERPSSLFLLDWDGKILWEREVGGVGFELSTPLVRASSVYVASTDGNLYIINLTTGEVFKKLKLDNSTWGLTSSPVADERCIYLAGGDGNLTALTPDGDILWRVNLNTTFYFSTPILLEGEIYLGGRDGKIFAVNTTTGDVAWEMSLNGTIKAPLVTGPGAVYFSITFGEEISEIYRIDGNSHQLQKVKTISTALTSSFNAFQLNGRWTLAAGFDGGVYLVDASSGEVRTLPAEGPVTASALAVGGGVVFVTNTGGEGNLSTLYFYSSQGELLGTYVPTPNDWIFPTPLVHTSRLYLPTDAGDLHFVELLPHIVFSPGRNVVDVYVGDEVSFALLEPALGEDVEVTWYVDGEVAGGGATLEVSLPPGEHNVTAMVRLGDVELSRTWVVTVEREEGGGDVGGGRLGPGYYVIVAIPIALFAAIAAYIFMRKTDTWGGAVEE